MSNITLCSRSLKSINKLFTHAKQYGKLAITDDGSTLIALHPERKFPYELSRPLPEVNEATQQTILKMENITEIKRVFKDVMPDAARAELMRITNTTKHIWYPRSRDKKAKKTPMDRPFL